MIGLAIFWDATELNPVWIMVFMSVLLNYLKSPEKIIISVLETQSSTYHELRFACQRTVEPVELSIALSSVLLNWLQKQRHTLYVWENATLIDVVVTLVKWRCELQRRNSQCWREAALDWCWDMALDWCWDGALVGTRFLEREDRFRCFEARMQAPLETRAWIGDLKVVKNFRAWMSTCLAQTGLEIHATN